MKIIQLTQGQVAFVDDEDFEYINQWSWCANKKADGSYYARRGFRPQVYMHNLIMKTKGVDHKDRNQLNNCKCNLRLASDSQNACNRQNRYDSLSQYKGVTLNKNTGRWMARIQVNGKRICLGTFKYEIEAAIAYNISAKKYFGEFALLNIF